MVVLFRNFQETSTLFSIEVVPLQFSSSTQVLMSLHTYQHLLLSVLFLTLVILMGVKWYVLMCISLMISDVSHLFMCLLAICIFPWPIFKLDYLTVFVVALQSFTCSGYDHLTRYMIGKYFLPFYRLPFHFIDCVLWFLKVLLLWCLWFWYQGIACLTDLIRKCFSFYHLHVFMKD